MEKFKLLNRNITLELANQICTNISFLTFVKYTESLKNKDLNKSISILYEIYDKGYSVMDILDNYFLFVKTTQLLNENEIDFVRYRNQIQTIEKIIDNSYRKNSMQEEVKITMISLLFLNQFIIITFSKMTEILLHVMCCCVFLR
jgi:DNA polymerase III gamma/tau subunit